MGDLPELAISIRQPWAWCILHAGKDIENREWWTRFRGPVAIHAAKGMTRDEYEQCLATVHAISRTHPFPTGLTMPAMADLQRGGIVGVAKIVDCVTNSRSPWFFGRCGFVLREVHSVDFIPAKGALGFFDWRANVLAPKQTSAAQQGSMF